VRILITGSEGFVSQHLIRELEDAGHLVSGMDIVFGTYHDAYGADNVRSHIESARADALIHLAANVDCASSENDVLETVRDHVGMTAVVAQVCGELGVRMVYASSDEIYGDSKKSVCHELNGPFLLPLSTYGLAKRCGEKMCRLHAPQGFTALRFSTIYGPGLATERSALIRMLWQAKYNLPIPVHIGAERSWCWIGDAVRAIRLVVEKGEGPYNIGRDEDGTSMVEVAQIACALSGSDQGLIDLVEALPGETLVKRLSVDRVRNIGWQPAVSLYDGMQMTLETWVRYADEDGSHAPVAAEAI
jgi:nucleoside-diphosphate-sugar epimerase